MFGVHVIQPKVIWVPSRVNEKRSLWREEWAELTSGGVSLFHHLQAEPTETLGRLLWAGGSTRGEEHHIWRGNDKITPLPICWCTTCKGQLGEALATTAWISRAALWCLHHWLLRDWQNSQLKPYTLPLFIFHILLLVPDVRPKVHGVFCSWKLISLSWTLCPVQPAGFFSIAFTSCSPNSQPIQQQKTKNLFFFTGYYCMFTPLSHLSHKIGL